MHCDICRTTARTHDATHSHASTCPWAIWGNLMDALANPESHHAYAA